MCIHTCVYIQKARHMEQMIYLAKNIGKANLWCEIYIKVGGKEWCNKSVNHWYCTHRPPPGWHQTSAMYIWPTKNLPKISNMQPGAELVRGVRARPRGRFQRGAGLDSRSPRAGMFPSPGTWVAARARLTRQIVDRRSIYLHNCQ